MKTENGYRVDARQIEFGRMVWYILKKWRAILLLSVVFGIATGLWKYASDSKAHQRAYEEALLASQNNAQTLSVEEIKSRLSEKEILGVYRAMYYGKRTEEATDYMWQSLLMQENPYAQNIKYLYIESESTHEIKAYVCSEAFCTEVLEQLKWDTQPRYMEELIDCETEENTVIIRLSGRTADECRELFDVVQKRVEQKFKSDIIDSYGYEDIVVNTELVKLYNEVYQDNASSNDIFERYEANFNYWQKTLYIALAGTEADDGNAVAAAEEITLEPTYFSKKMAAFGAAAGIVVAIVLFGLIFTFSPAIHGKDEMERLYDATVIGTVNVAALGKKRFGAGLDRRIDRLGDKSGAALTYGEQLDMAAAAIYLICGKKGYRSVYLTGSRLEKLPQAFAEQLQAALKEKGIALTAGKSIISDAASLLAAADCQGIVFAESDEKSKCAAITDELNLCMKQGMDNLGVIMVQEDC